MLARQLLRIGLSILLAVQVALPQRAFAGETPVQLGWHDQNRLSEIFGHLEQQYKAAQTLEEKILVIAVINHFLNEILSELAKKAESQDSPPSFILTLSAQELRQMSIFSALSAEQQERLKSVLELLAKAQAKEDATLPQIAQEDLNKIELVLSLLRPNELMALLNWIEDNFIERIAEAMEKDHLPVQWVAVQPESGKAYDDIIKQIQLILAQVQPPEQKDLRKGFLHNMLISMSRASARWRLKRELKKQQSGIDLAVQEKQDMIRQTKKAEESELRKKQLAQMRMELAYERYKARAIKNGDYWTSFDGFKYKYNSKDRNQDPIDTVFRMIGISLLDVLYYGGYGFTFGFLGGLATFIGGNMAGASVHTWGTLTLGAFIVPNVIGLGVAAQKAIGHCQNILDGYEYDR